MWNPRVRYYFIGWLNSRRNYTRRWTRLPGGVTFKDATYPVFTAVDSEARMPCLVGNEGGDVEEGWRGGGGKAFR